MAQEYSLLERIFEVLFGALLYHKEYLIIPPAGDIDDIVPIFPVVGQ